jgi:cobalt-zinc-cadmium efflux system protein
MLTQVDMARCSHAGDRLTSYEIHFIQRHMGHHHHHHHGHDEHHHHHHAHDPGEGSRRALLWSLGLNGILLVIEVVVGWWSGSLALLSDAAHMLSDVGALALAFVAAQLAARPATPGATYGFVRAEVLGAFLNAVALVVACVFIFEEAVERLLSEPPPFAAGPVLAVGAVGLAVNLGSAWFLWRSDRYNINIRAALAHMLADALGSLGAMVAAVLVMTTGWLQADAVVSIFIGVLVLWSTWAILRDSTRVLMDFAPVGLDQRVVADALRSVPHVVEVHDIHVRTLRTGRATVTAHLVTDGAAPMFEVLGRAEGVLRERLHVHHSTLQFDEPASAERCPQRECTPFAKVAPHGHSH